MTYSTTPTGHPTWRPKRQNCTPPAIEQFPRPLMGQYARSHGGLIIHVIVAIYTFLGLAIVCDKYFVSSLDRICEEVKLAPDVAGATFMAAGSSAPELATVVIGVFFAKDDIGISGVIGSAVFNIMFVISVCALCAGTVSHLNWWPLVRDCFFYAISILVMLFTIIDETVTWAEATFMLCMYVVYCVCLHFNSALESWVTMHVPLPASCVKAPEEESALVSYRTLHEDRTRIPSYSTSPPATTPTVQQPAVESTGLNSWNDDMDHGFGAAPTNFGAAPTNFGAAPTSGAPATQALMPQQPPPPQIQLPITQDYYKPKSDQDRPSPLIKPTEGGYFELYSWAIVFPIHYMCTKTMPDCKTEKYKNWYPFTFFISMIWISFYSYIMVWMITIIGSTLGIPDTVMGLTFVAAGVSVPDALSSIAVIKEGYGDMAVSNAVGSNVFDILICLGLPWFIQTAIIKPGSHVNVISKGLTYSTLSLLSTVVFLVVATHLNGWKLDKRYGVILMIC
ncbi:uncharacterized protein CBL_05036 [Carabus blaptoides fortunei]